MAQNPSSPQERIISIPWSHLIRLFWLNLFGHKNRKWLRCVAPWELPPFIRCESIVKPMASWTRLSLYHALTASSSMVVSCGAAPYLWGISWFFSHTNNPHEKAYYQIKAYQNHPKKLLVGSSAHVPLGIFHGSGMTFRSSAPPNSASVLQKGEATGSVSRSALPPM